MDALRGFAIVLVVFYHGVGIPGWYFGMDAPGWMTWASLFLAPIRMPLLLALSGMLLGHSLAKPASVYYAGKVRTLVWPLAVWVVIEGLTTEWLTDGHGYSLLDPEAWFDTTHLWFLAYLAVYFFLARPLRRVPPWILALAAWTGSGIAALWAEHSLAMSVLSDLGHYGGFFFLGASLVGWQDRLDRWMGTPLLGVLAVLALGYGVLHATWQGDTGFATASVPFSVAGILVACRLARTLPEGSLPQVRFIGRYSIVFYLPHVFVQLLVGRLAVLAGFEGPAWILVVTGVLAALLTGWVLAAFKTNPLVGVLFEFPRRPPSVGRPAHVGLEATGAHAVPE